MTLRHGLHVSGAAAGVTAPQDARLAMSGVLSGPGVLSGGAVTGSTSGPNMKYTIAAGVFVCARGTVAGDGVYITANDGPVTVDSGSPAPGSGSRYDVVYVLHRNAFASDGFGDANSDPTFGVVVGTASSTPVVPAVPAGALAIGQALVGTSIANASLATITQVAPAVAAVGGILPTTGPSQYPAGPVVGDYIDDASLGLLRWNGTVWVQVLGLGLQTFTPVWTGLTVGNGTQVAEYQINGKIMTLRIWLQFGSTTAITGNVSVAMPGSFTAKSDGFPQDLFCRISSGAAGATRLTGFANVGNGGNSLAIFEPTSNVDLHMVQLGSFGQTFGAGCSISVQGTLVIA